MSIRNNHIAFRPGIKKNQFGLRRIGLVVFLVIGLIFALIIFQIGREVAPLLTTEQQNTSVPTTVIPSQNPAVPQVTNAPVITPAQTTVSVTGQTATTTAPKPTTKSS